MSGLDADHASCPVCQGLETRGAMRWFPPLSPPTIDKVTATITGLGYPDVRVSEVQVEHPQIGVCTVCLPEQEHPATLIVRPWFGWRAGVSSRCSLRCLHQALRECELDRASGVTVEIPVPKGTP